MQSLNLTSLLPGSPLMNTRPSTRLGLLLDALQPTPGQSVGAAGSAAAAEAVAPDGAPVRSAPLLPVEPAGQTRLSEAGLMLAQMGMKPRSPLELMLRFSATATADAGSEVGGDVQHAAQAAAAGGLAEVDSRVLAQQLRNVITRSGLFYESHVQEWAQGRRPLSELQQEPQQRWLAGREPAPANDPAWGADGRALPAASERPARTDADARAANDPAWSASPQRPVPAALEDLVARQLEVLATRQLHLHLLPGQDAPVSLMIGQEHSADQSADCAPDLQAWVTEIECTLPELGTVHARLRLLGDQLAVTVHAADGTRADWLDAQLGELRVLLERSGLTPALLEVRHES